MEKYRLAIATAVAAVVLTSAGAQAAKDNIIHDAEYYILKAQHGEKWQKQDKELNAKLAALHKKIRQTTKYYPYYVGRHGSWRNRCTANPGKPGF